MALPPEKKRRRQEAAEHSSSGAQGPANAAQSASLSRQHRQTPSATPDLPEINVVRRSARNQNAVKASVNASGNRNIHSFFNAKTNLQTKSSPLPRSQSNSRARDAATSLDLEEDGIEEVDDSGSFALHAGRSSHGEGQNIPGKRSKPSSGKSSVPADAAVGSEQEGHGDHRETSSNIPWADAFPPLSLEELAVNKKKVETINSWMKEALSGHRYRRMLVLRGPAGCGKSSTVRLLAHARHVHLAEWSNPLQSVFGDENYVSISAQFSDFMNRGGQFSTLNFDGGYTKGASQQNSSNSGEILLVDEFPFAYSAGNTNTKMRESLMLHLEADRASPLILIFSEDEVAQPDLASSTTAYQLLGSDLLTHPATAVIDCNKIATTYMIKALELVVKKEARQSNRPRPISLPTLRTLASSGDIRSAIGLLQILCTDDHQKTQTGRLPAKRSSAGSRKEVSSDDSWSLEASCREASVGLFHAIGKVVYNKRELTQADRPDRSSSPVVSHHEKMASVVEIEDIIRLLGSDSDTFVAGLQENYAPSCEAEDCLSHIEACASELSSADLLNASQRARTNRNGTARTTVTTVEQVLQQEITTQAAIRGLLYSLPYPVRRGGTKPDASTSRMTFPASVRLPRQEAETLADIDRWLRLSSCAADSSSLHSTHSFAANRGVEAWASHDKSSASAEDLENAGGGQITAFNSVTGTPNRTELVLVQLPYQVKIMSANVSSHDLRTLRQITEVRKVPHLPLPSANGHGGSHFGGHQEPLKLVPDKLFLSDDDIEEF